jgi:hypothetical protein
VQFVALGVACSDFRRRGSPDAVVWAHFVVIVALTRSLDSDHFQTCELRHVFGSHRWWVAAKRSRFIEPSRDAARANDEVHRVLQALVRALHRLLLKTSSACPSSSYHANIDFVKCINTTESGASASVLVDIDNSAAFDVPRNLAEIQPPCPHFLNTSPRPRKIAVTRRLGYLLG